MMYLSTSVESLSGLTFSSSNMQLSTYCWGGLGNAKQERPSLIETMGITIALFNLRMDDESWISVQRGDNTIAIVNMRVRRQRVSLPSFKSARANSLGCELVQPNDRPPDYDGEVMRKFGAIFWR